MASVENTELARSVDAGPIQQPVLAIKEPTALFARRPEALTPKQTKKPKPDQTPRVSFVVPFSDQIRNEVTTLYTTYAKTGTVPSLGTLRSHLIDRIVTVIVPTNPGHAALLADELHLYLEDTDSELLADYCGFAKLPTKNKPAACKPVSSFRFSMESSLLSSMRAQVAAPKQTPKQPTPAQSLTEGADVGGALSWIWDLLEGDFNDNPDVAQTIIGSLIGLIPVVDQACDIRDLIANLIALTYYRRYDEFTPWFNLVVTLIGAIPEIGSVFKGIGKLVEKGASKLPIEQIAKLAGKLDVVEGLGHMRGLIDAFLGEIGAHAGAIAEKAVAILEGQLHALEKLKATAGWFSASAKRYIENLIAATRGALERAATKIKAAMSYLADRLRELMDAIKERLGKLTQETKSTSKVSAATIALRERFLLKYPSGVATAWRGVRLPPGAVFKGTIGNEGTMVILEGGENAALHYALAPTKNAFKTSDKDTIYLLRMDIRADDIIAYPNLEALDHVLLDPLVNLLRLPNFIQRRLTVAEARKLYSP